MGNEGPFNMEGGEDRRTNKIVGTIRDRKYKLPASRRYIKRFYQIFNFDVESILCFKLAYFRHRGISISGSMI